jgi:hypothetical protein
MVVKLEPSGSSDEDTQREITKMRFLSAAILSIGFGLFLQSADAQQVTLQSMPPVVVKTVPEAGSSDVSPGLTEVKVTFSKEMQDESWSWSTLGAENFPETTGKPTYQADKRTCVLPVKLKPGRTYAMWLNSQRYRNFKDSSGQPGVPYLLVFKTKG